MPSVNYRTRNFGLEFAALAADSGSVSVTWPEIVHAAITLGRRGWFGVW